MNLIGNSLDAWHRSGAATNFRSRIIAFLCARYGNLSRSRSHVRSLIRSIIGLFSRGDEVMVRFRCSGQPVTVHLRKDNDADYLVFGEITMGAYPLQDLPMAVPSHVVDGGSNIGLFSLLAHATFPGASLTCYEPDPWNVARIQRNFEANGVKARVLQMGLWSSRKDLFFHSELSYNGSVSDAPSGTPVSCELPEIPGNCLLKLDIEGAEHEVLPALFAAGRFPASILMEIHEFNSRGESLLTLLRENGSRWDESFSFAEPCVNVFAFRE
jgi:FkbM family methyltransferase